MRKGGKLALTLAIGAITVGALSFVPFKSETFCEPREKMTDSKTNPNPKHHHPKGGFCNMPGGPGRTVQLSSIFGALGDYFALRRNLVVPDTHVLPSGEVGEQIAAAGNPSVTWLGHASFIIRIGGKIVLTDPFLGETAGPMGFGPKRFVDAPMTPLQLPEADVMVVSHNHYDHLDAKTVEEYPYKDTIQVIVPLGLGGFFTTRGYRNVLEHDWWESWEKDGLTIVTTPAQHFSGRGPFDRNKTLWASFAIITEEERVWFSGDTARGAIFKEIGEKYGPFDLGLIAIGAYEPRDFMQAVHANPEEAVGIARDVRARKVVGMHWGTIILTTEDPFEPPVRFKKAAEEQGLGADNAIVLRIGESMSFAEEGALAEAVSN